MQDFAKKYTDNVKVVAVNHVSNVTGTITDIKAIKQKLRPETLFVVDGSQSIQHMPIDVQDLGCDFFVCTAHKFMAST